MAAKLLEITRIRQKNYGDLSPTPHYPSMPKGVTPEHEKLLQGSESIALFSVVGMTCSACAASIEKTVKRLPGIKDAAVDVLNNRAQVLFYPFMIDVSVIFIISVLLLSYLFS